MMKYGTKRLILRWIHIFFGIPILGYVYSPFEVLPSYAPIARFIAVPVIVLSGLWMWIQSAPKKSILVPLGVFLILLGLIGPLPFTPAPGTVQSHASHPDYFLIINLLRACLVVGIVCALLGAVRNRKLKQPAPEM
jgi:lipoprotein signal peptidase